MPQDVWDTSAVVKLYVAERGSAYAHLVAESHDIVISAITIVEVAAALRRRTLAGDISPTDRDAIYRLFLADVGGFTVIEVTPELRAEAARLLLVETLVTARLRGFDAVQLATARLWFEALRPITLHPGAFMVADSALGTAAGALGLPVDNPEEHE